MDNSHKAEPTHSSEDLDVIASLVHSAMQQRQGDGPALLALLRSLEHLHREICDGPFQESLPKSRHELYKLLRDIESQGGWPYIPRMRLQAILVRFAAESSDDQAQPNS